MFVPQLRQNVHCGLGNGLLEFVLGHAGHFRMLKNRDYTILPGYRAVEKADLLMASFPYPPPNAMPTLESRVKKIRSPLMWRWKPHAPGQLPLRSVWQHRPAQAETCSRCFPSRFAEPTTSWRAD